MPIFYIKDKDGNFVPVPALKGRQGEPGDSGVYVGAEQPDDPNVKVWVEPDGEADQVLTYSEQELTEEQKAQVKENIGVVEYTLPPATADTLGGVMPGQGIWADADGRISTDMSGRWEHIRTITLDADTAMIDFSTDKDGQPFELEAFRIDMMVKIVDSIANATLRINGLTNATNVPTSYGYSAFRRATLLYNIDTYGNGRIYMPPSVASTVSGPVSQSAYTFIFPQNMREPVNRIRYYLNTGDTKLFAAESTFELYGVRTRA